MDLSQALLVSVHHVFVTIFQTLVYLFQGFVIIVVELVINCMYM